MRRLSLIGCGLAALGGVALATPGNARPEKASAGVKRVVKAFGKLKSYHVDLQVDGGEAQGADHTIRSPTVSQGYRADVVRNLCRVTSPEAYRPRGDSQAGAIKSHGSFKSMLAVSEGVLVARLFLPAEQFLAEAVRFKKTARWVDAAGAEQPAPARGPVVASRQDDGEGTRTGSRGEAGESDAQAQAEAQAPRRIRVDGPSAVALEHFLTLQNSGCFREG